MPARYSISKEFHFSASHVLTGLPSDHPCGRLHGHNYVVVVVLESPILNEVGFVTDYGDLSPVKEYIDQHLDHRHLNDALPTNPTAENLAHHLFHLFAASFPTLAAVRVSETPKTWAEYRP